MPDDNFQDQLQPDATISNKDIIKEIDADNEKDYLRQLKKKNEDFLIEGLSIVERERIGKYISERFDEVKDDHKKKADKIDDYDSTYRMERKEIVGSDGSMPNYVTPLSTVTLEVVHSNMMNVFFTPQDPMRVIPTEEGDVPKVNKLSKFGNWSLTNELELFEQVDRLFHNSGKTGESPYILHWVKEYGTKVDRKFVKNPADPTQILYDPDTQEPIYQEVEEEVLLYNAPKLEPFSRKDYFQPKNALMGKVPEWEGRRLRMSFDEYLREELQGKMYKNSIKDILEWGESGSDDLQKIDYDGDEILLGRWEEEFREWCGRLRIRVIKTDKEDETEKIQELEDEYIAIVHLPSQTLCQLRKNKFPLKQRPYGMDYFIPDDEGRRTGIGVMEFMDSLQKSYDVAYNLFIQATTRSNNPFGFFSPMANQRKEPFKIQHGNLYPTLDPSSVNIVKMPPPDKSLNDMMEIIRNWAQLLFGISDYSAGVESKIDPDAPAKKAEIVVAQGNVRLNMIIKRKNKTLKEIFKRWFLLYQENMPPNKFMRIVGDSKDNPWKFEGVTLQDFALKSIPDFELVGNVLNVNKSFEANKKIAIYNILARNPFFSPQTQQGLQAHFGLTKWLVEGLDETGLSRLLPPIPGETVYTPEEENARFMQGDEGDPEQGEDHVNHIRVHRQLLVDQTLPDEVKQIAVNHINKTVELMQQEITQQMVLGQAGVQPGQFMQQQQGGGNGGVARPETNVGAGQQGLGEGTIPRSPAGV